MMFEPQLTASYFVLGALGLLGLVYKYWKYLAKDQGLCLPPGPPGNRLSVGPNTVRQFNEWAAEYGPIFSFKSGRQRFVVLTTYQAAVDVMQKHGSDLADRPRTVAAGEICSGGMRTLLVGAGERLRKLRRALHANLQASTARQYASVQHRNAKNYIRNVMEDPEHHLDHARTYAASVIMELTYSKTTPTKYSDPEVQAVMKCITNMFEALRIGCFLVDTLPLLKYIPLGGVAKLRRYHQEELSLFKSQLYSTKAQLARNAAQPSFATYLLEHQQEFDLSDAELAYLAGSMFGAGSDTTASGLGIVTMAAATHPQELKKVHAQLDEVVGRERLPNFDDEPFLPKVIAFVLEVHRWRLITPFGFAHKATKDIVWKNYVIPSGTIVYGNHWSIMHDPEVFVDPEKFNSDRWLNEKGAIRDDLKHFDFGFGRRACPGQYVAERSLFINTALMCWAFDIREDPTAPIDTMAFTDGSVVHPHPFRVRIEPRIRNLSEILDAETDG